MERIKSIETVYKGIKFRSKLEAQWAVFFDECNIEWEYEPQGFKLDNGMWYLPDFLLHNVNYQDRYIDLFVEVKGLLNEKDKEKIINFSYSTPIILLGNIPWGYSYNEMIEDINEKYDDTYFFNSFTIDGFDDPCFLGMVIKNKHFPYDNYSIFDENSEFGIIEIANDYRVDKKETEEKYYNARNYRFDHRR